MEERNVPIPQPEKAKPRGCAVFGWSIFSVLLLIVTIFGYKVWSYAKQIRSGNIIELPQFSSHFTAAANTTGLESDFASRAIVEAGTHPELGTKDAVLTIVEFADFECPYSKEASTTVRRLMAKYGDKVRFIYRDFPVASLHPNAMGTAVAASCADEQGKFWQMHDKIYAAAPPFTFEALKSMGREIGLDAAQFERCLIENRYKDDVNFDLQTAQALGLRGTPTFYLNGQKIEGAVPEEVLEKLITRYIE